MADKIIINEYSSGQVTASNIRNNINSPVLGVSNSITADRVTEWWDGSPMDVSKVDNRLYIQYNGEDYPEYVGSYFKVNLPNEGQLFLEKNSVSDLRSIDIVEKILLQSGYYKGVKLNGYRSVDDTETPIIYSVDNSATVDNGGSVIITNNNLVLSHVFTKDVDIRYFGALADNSFDNSDIINTVADYCRANRLNIIIPPTTNFFRIKKSIYLGNGQNRQSPLLTIGTGRFKSRIMVDLEEVFAAIDLGDCGRCQLQNIEIRSTAASQHTLIFFLYQTQLANCNLMTFDNVFVEDSATAAKGVLFGWTSDQVRFVNGTELNQRENGFCVKFSFDNPLNFRSKFRTEDSYRPSKSDCTYISAHNSNFLASSGYAFSIEYYSLLSCDNVYFANTRTGSTNAMIHFKSGDRFLSPKLVSCRTENQSNNDNIDLIYIEDRIYNMDINGVFTAKGTGAMFSNGSIVFGVFKGTPATRLFNNIGNLNGVVFECYAGTNSLGTIQLEAQSASQNLQFKGRCGSLTDLKNAFSSTIGLVLDGVSASGYGGLKQISSEQIIAMPRSDSPGGYRSQYSLSTRELNRSSYVGGSGFGNITTTTISPSALFKPSTSNLATPKVVAKYWGRFAATIVDGSIRVQANQDVSSLNVVTLSGLTSAVAGRVFEIEVNILPLGSGLSIVFYGKINVYRQDGTILSVGSYMNATSTILVASSANIILNVQVSTSVDAPLSQVIELIES